MLDLMNELFNLILCFLPIVLIVGAFYMLFLICIPGFMEMNRFKKYTGKAEAVILKKQPFDYAQSAAAVWEKKGQDYVPVNNTSDKSSYRNEAIIFSALMAKFNSALTISWTAEGREWKAKYPHMVSNAQYDEGDHVTLHYDKKQPWKYVMENPREWAATIRRTVIWLVLLAASIIVLIVFNPLQYLV